MNSAVAENSISFILPLSDSKMHICFSGGEPLLNFEIIRNTVQSIIKKRKGKRIDFSIITNGLLINDEIFDFFEAHNFSVQISILFNEQISNSEKIFTKKYFDTILRLQNSGNITLSSNSVYSPDNISTLITTALSIKDLNIDDIGISLDLSPIWKNQDIIILKNQLAELREICYRDYMIHGHTSFRLFNTEEDLFIHGCGAGDHKVTITTDGDLWGCDCFYFYFKNRENLSQGSGYYYGNVISDHPSEIIKRSEAVKQSYEEFRADRYHTRKMPCFLCPNVMECFVCPAVLYSDTENSDLFFIPDHICEINKILISQSKILREQISKGQSV